MIGQTAPINHTRDGLPFTGTVTTNAVQTKAAQGIFQPVPKRMVIDRGNTVDTIRNRLNNQPTALPPIVKDLGQKRGRGIKPMTAEENAKLYAAFKNK